MARREIAQRILTARGHGDLKENAEYHAAKDDQAHLETRIQRLRQRLRSAVVVRDRDRGAALLLRPLGRDPRRGHRRDLHLDDRRRHRGRPRTGKLSAESPIARALLDHAVGDTVEVPTPKRVRRLKIVRLV